MDFENLSPEMKDKVKACRTGKELADLASSIGYELNEDELKAIAGGDDVNWTCVSDGRVDCIRDEIFDI